ncbi:MAG TPA: GxxExxY protein [Pseudoxanthomonas sp.]
MNTDEAMLIQKDLSGRVLGVFFDVYNALGHGFLESVYENALAIALVDSGLAVERQTPINVNFRGHCVGEFRADVLVENLLILEIKAQATLTPIHEAQLLNYLKATNMPLGLLLNFGPRPQFKRRVFTESFIRVDPRQSVAETDV